MTATFILDTSFIGNAVRFERHYEKQFPSLQNGALSVGALQHMGECGATYILPNKVLHELTDRPFALGYQNGFAQTCSQGLSCTEEGVAYLDSTLLDSTPERFESVRFLAYLKAQYMAGNVKCFRSAEDYQHVRQYTSLAGKIAIVPGTPLTAGDGMRIHEWSAEMPRARIFQKGDEEIIKLRNYLIPTQSPDRVLHEPYCLLTNDRQLKERFLVDGKLHGNHMAANSRLFAHMLVNTGYDHTPALEGAIAAYDANYSREKKHSYSIGCKVSEAVDRMAERFLIHGKLEKPTPPANIITEAHITPMKRVHPSKAHRLGENRINLSSQSDNSAIRG